MFLSQDAENTKCIVMVNKLKYQVYPPQTINIKKSHEEMHVKCMAPGNRVVEAYVPPKVSYRSAWGTPIGVAWDYASDSLYYYPSIIALDFTNQKVLANKMPAHDDPALAAPESYHFEEVGSSTPMLNSDKDYVAPRLLKRGETYVPPGERDLKAVVDDLGGGEFDGDSLGTDDAADQPVPLYPGQ